MCSICYANIHHANNTNLQICKEWLHCRQKVLTFFCMKVLPKELVFFYIVPFIMTIIHFLFIIQREWKKKKKIGPPTYKSVKHFVACCHWLVLVHQPIKVTYFHEFLYIYVFKNDYDYKCMCVWFIWFHRKTKRTNKHIEGIKVKQLYLLPKSTEFKIEWETKKVPIKPFIIVKVADTCTQKTCDKSITMWLCHVCVATCVWVFY